LKTYLIVPDLHYPYQCPLFVKLTFKLLKDIRFNGIVQLGDALDFWQLSTFDKDPARKNTIGDDIDEWNELLTKWASLLYRNSEIHLLCGNHEYRLDRYVSRHARELHEIVPPMVALLRIKERNAAGSVVFKWHPYNKWNSLMLGDCIFLHGFYFNQHTAMTNLKKYRANTVSGHTHRVQFVTDGTHYACSLGHGSDELKTAHQPTPTEWTQALGILTVKDDGSTAFEIAIVKEGKAVVRGKAY
jgi:Calcineurin-like phosphoesterase